MPYKDPAAKRRREAERRVKFTPEQKAAAAEHSRLYMQHRRLTDASYLEKTRESTRRLYKKHRSKRIEDMRRKNWEARIACLRAYSPGRIECACCQEDIHEFLTLDHIKDRKHDDGVRVGGDRISTVLFLWLIRMNFPPGLRVLCYNCNCTRARLGYCPHEQMREVQDMAV